MFRLLNDPDSIIELKVKARAMLLAKAEKQKLKEREIAFSAYVEEYKQTHPEEAQFETNYGIDVIRENLRLSFEFIPSEEAQARIQAIYDEAYSILPEYVQAERWRSTDCDCVVERVADKRDYQNTRQTFKATRCPAHEGLSIEELHDTREEETLRRRDLNIFLMENFDGVVTEATLGAGENSKPQPKKIKDGVEIEFEWEGTGKNRVVKPVLKGVELNIQEKKKIEDFGKTKFGKNKIRVE